MRQGRIKDTGRKQYICCGAGPKTHAIEILLNQRKVSGLFYHFVLPPPEKSRLLVSNRRK